ncbi:MAG: FtsX-like permease family protein [Ardenticatenaceae bacterium]|nr:FtsX-like permease family protein [Ardenticatenaceae bacterium]
MSVIWYKVWNDIWQRKVRTALAVFSIAAGVFAIGTIFGMVDQLLSTMNASHQATNPSHVNVILRQRIDLETVRGLERIEGIVGVEPLNILAGRYKTDPDGRWESATFVMRNEFDNQQFDQLTLLEGDWPNRGNIAVERLSHNAFDIDIGDSLILELDGTDRAFPVTGMIRHPFVPPPDFGGDAHILLSEEVVARMGIPQGLYNQLLVQVEPYSEAYARDRMAVVKDQLAKQGLGIVFTVYQEPEEHWGQPFLEGVNLVLQVLAIVSLFASVILVINTMTAVITQQIDQIGVIKALGGTTDLLTRVYLAGVLIYGVLAAVIALPLGMLMAYAASRWMLNIFNIDYEIFQFSTRAVVFQLLAALIAPLLAALWPVMQGAAISVREAIASYGLGGDFGFSRFDRLIEGVAQRFLSSPYAIALGNMFRRKGRLLLTQGVLIIAGTMFMMVLTLSNSVNFTLENELARRGYEIRFVLGGLERESRVTELALRYPEIVAAEAWYTVTGTVTREGEAVKDTAGLGSELFAVPSGSRMYTPNIVAGRWLTESDRGNVVIISKDTAEFNGLTLGDRLTIDLGELGEGVWEIIGIYQAIASEPFSTDPIYAPEAAVTAVTKKANRARQLYLTIDPPTAAVTGELKRELVSDFEMLNIPVSMFQTRTIHEERAYAYEQFSIVTQLLLGLSIVMALVGGVGLAGALSISVVERTREIGVLRAIGAESASIMGMFMMEGVLQGVMSWILAVPIAFIVARPMALALGEIMLQTGLDFSFDFAAVGYWLLLVVVISTLASVLPALSATRISVRESLAYG